MTRTVCREQLRDQDRLSTFRASSGTKWQYSGSLRPRGFFRTPTLEMASEGKVRSRLLQFVALCLLLVCVCGPVAETFDFWDHTLQTGNDIEYSLVTLALVAGAGFGIVHAIAIVMRAVSLTHCLLLSVDPSLSCAPPSVAGTCCSPPQPLRI